MCRAKEALDAKPNPAVPSNYLTAGRQHLNLGCLAFLARWSVVTDLPHTSRA